MNETNPSPISVPMVAKFIFRWKDSRTVIFGSFTDKKVLDNLCDMNPVPYFQGERFLRIGDIYDFKEIGKGKITSIRVDVRDKKEIPLATPHHWGAPEIPSSIEIHVVFQKL